MKVDKNGNRLNPVYEPGEWKLFEDVLGVRVMRLNPVYEPGEWKQVLEITKERWKTS